MKKNFWSNLPRPFFALAPMADVTDAAFRRIIAKYGRPDLFYTEFVSCDGLMSRGRETLLLDFMYSESERPIVAQIFGGKPENFCKCAQLIERLGFDGIDINMGCPDRSVEKQGAGAALMKDTKRAREIIREAKLGAPSIPVSVKTRTGYNENNLDDFLPEILAEEPAAIIIHARTRKEMSKVPADWEQIARAVKIRDDIVAKSGKNTSKTLIVGNGDIESIEDGKAKVLESGADGVMLGRAVFGNPWLFTTPPYFPSVEQKLRVLVEHTKLFTELFDKRKNFAIMKKHFGAYTTGFPGAKELRMQLMNTQSEEEVQNAVLDFLDK